MNKYNDHKVCNSCGHNNSVDSSFCTKCGDDIEYNKIEVDTYTRTLESFVGNNSDFYIEKKKMMEEQSRIFSWNWPAFLIPPTWFIYRKMYGIGITLVAINIVFSNIDFNLSFIHILINIGSGLYANTLYLNHVDKQILKLDELEESTKSEFIRKKGGVTILIPILGMILIFIIQYFLLSNSMYC